MTNHKKFTLCKKFTFSKNGLTKDIQDAILRLNFDLSDDELFGTTSQRIQWCTRALTNDTILMKANNVISLAERQELTAKNLYRHLMGYFATIDEFKMTEKHESVYKKLKELAKAIS